MWSWTSWAFLVENLHLIEFVDRPHGVAPDARPADHPLGAAPDACPAVKTHGLPRAGHSQSLRFSPRALAVGTQRGIF